MSNYLVERYELDPNVKLEDPSSVREKEDDAFSRFYTKQTKKNWLKERPPKRAYRIKGERNENLEIQLLEGTVSVRKMLEKARSCGTTIAVLVTAVYIEAILQEMRTRERKYPIVISVPVNLRNYFPSHTTRNFFGVINVSYNSMEYDGIWIPLLNMSGKHFRNCCRKIKFFRP